MPIEPNLKESPALKKRKVDSSTMSDEILPVYGGDEAAFAAYKVSTSSTRKGLMMIFTRAKQELTFFKNRKSMPNQSKILPSIGVKSPKQTLIGSRLSLMFRMGLSWMAP
jgi:hypothetical protein